MSYPESDRSVSLLRRRHVLRTMAALPLAAAWWPASMAATRGIVGQKAPELDAEFWLDGDGEKSSFSMQAQRGKWVYLKCWQSWCPGCHSHGFPALKRVSDAFAGEPRVAVVGIQTTFEGHLVNTGDKVREIQVRYDLRIPMGHDPGKRNADGYPNTMRSYRTGGTPWQVIIDPSGLVVYDGFRINVDRVIEHFKRQIEA